MTKPGAGQTWERRDGSRFTIERIKHGYAVYWLSSGPQFRYVRLDRLTGQARNYRLVREPRTSAEDRAFYKEDR